VILKNVAGQGLFLFAYNSSGPVTGGAANITGYYSLDGGTATVFATANPTEVSSTHMAGIYWQALAQAETNGNAIAFEWTDSTAGVSIDPILVLTSGAGVPVLLTETLAAPRALDSIADTSLTLNDAFQCAVATVAGKQTTSGTTYTTKTPSTGTVLRTFTLDQNPNPNNRT